MNKLLTALNECTEWGQIFILDSVAEYSPQDAREAQSICERVTPRLSHANAAVVLSTIKGKKSDIFRQYLEFWRPSSNRTYVLISSKLIYIFVSVLILWTKIL